MNMAIKAFIDQIKTLPPVLKEKVLGISLQEIRDEIRNNVIEEIRQETTKDIYQELEDDLPNVVRDEIVNQRTQRCGLYSYYTPGHNASEWVVSLGQIVANEIADLRVTTINTLDDSDSEGSSGDYDYPDEL